jgi:ferredoxin
MSKIIVDKDKCIGCGSCVAMYPELFVLASDNKSQVISDDYTVHHYSKEEIESICPSGAISVKD